jgi:outer membrane protein assembly factor BamA
VGLRYDTRDSQWNPYGGWYAGARAEAALLQTDWVTGAVYTFDGSKIFKLPGLFHSGGTGDEENPPTDVLAAWARMQVSSGDLPFYSLPTLGGPDTMRGYIAGRWRDRSSWTASLEYRLWILTRGIPIYGPYRIERVGLALFYELGAVAPSALDFPDSKVRHCAGLGARLSLERAAPFRVDVGFSDEGANLTARFGLPF